MIYLVTNQRSAFTPFGYSLATIQESIDYLSKLDVIAFDTETASILSTIFCMGT